MIASELECNCVTKVLTERTFRNGVKHYCYQCITCGRNDSCISKEKAMQLANAGTPIEPNDEMAHDRYLTMIRNIENSRRATQKERALAEYSDYLQSPEWKEKRQLVIKRAGGICEGCGVSRIQEIHHETYIHLGKELLYELKGLCKKCHEVAHQ